MSRARVATAVAGAVLAAAAASGCPEQTPVPGIAVGVYEFQTALLADGCAFDEPPKGPGTFVGTVSVDSAGKAYLTVGSHSHSGTLEDGRLVVSSRARRTMPAPWSTSERTVEGQIVERIEGRLVGEREAVAFGSCEGIAAARADAGTPGWADAGAATDGGSGDGSAPDAGPDWRLICGFLSDEFSALDTDAERFGPCLVLYSLSGRRQ